MEHKWLTIMEHDRMCYAMKESRMLPPTSSSATSLYEVVRFVSTFWQTLRLKWRNPLLCPALSSLSARSPVLVAVAKLTIEHGIPLYALTRFRFFPAPSSPESSPLWALLPPLIRVGGDCEQR